MKIGNRLLFWIGIGLFVLLGISYFIGIDVESGANYIVQDSLLGILIFHNPFVFAFYILIGIVLIVKSFRS
tara:strand:- start:5684 stop:5896 length:213 start_codon:yes stop_codon:yes gene_type:complete